MLGSHDDPHALPDRSGASTGGGSFGDSHRRLPDQRRGVYPGQMTFEWQARPESPAVSTAPATSVVKSGADASLPSPGEPPIRRAPTSRQLASKSPALLSKKHRLAEIVEKFLRDKGVPYIAVDEAKKALFAGAKLRSFHFVVYRPTDKNWLLWAAKYMNKDIRQDLIQWQAIFGDGFVAAVAKQTTDGTLRFQKLDGERIELDPPAQ